MLSVNLQGKNKYYNLYKAVRGEILSGRISAGERLPSKRALAEQLGVSVVTVGLAYEQLLAEGYVYSKERSGYFVEKVSLSPQREKSVPDFPKTEEKPTGGYKIDLVKGSAPASLFPFTTWAKLIRRVLSDCGEHLLERVPCDGDRELKREIAAYLYRSRGIVVNPEYIVIGAGAEYLYGIIVQLLGRGSTIAVENPGYAKISATYKLNGACVAPVPIINFEAFCAEVEEGLAAAVHVSPSHQFPTGAVMPVSARLRLIKRAEESGAYIIEDEYDSEFRLSGKPLQSMYSLSCERVIYMNTFSKSLAPSMRMGYMILAPALYSKFMELYSSNANVVPLFEQKTLAAMLGGGYFERHISRLKNYYRGIHAEIIKRLSAFGERCELSDTGSGLHITVKFPYAKSDAEIKEKARAAGINLKCVSDYLLSPLDGVERLAVINYSGVTESGLAAFDQAFKNL